MIRVLRDNDVRASSRNKGAGYAEGLRMLRERQTGYVVIPVVDRFFRNLRDLEDVIDICLETGAALVAAPGERRRGPGTKPIWSGSRRNGIPALDRRRSTAVSCRGPRDPAGGNDPLRPTATVMTRGARERGRHAAARPGPNYLAVAPRPGRTRTTCQHASCMQMIV